MRRNRRVIQAVADVKCPTCGAPLVVDQFTFDAQPDHVCENGHTWAAGVVPVRNTRVMD